MKIIVNDSLSQFRWWGGAVSRAQMLTSDELDELNALMEDVYPDGVEDVTINDNMWFEFEWVCEMLGLQYDVENDVVYR